MLVACARQIIEHIRYVWKIKFMISIICEEGCLNERLISLNCSKPCLICSSTGSSRSLVLSLGLRDHSLVGNVKIYYSLLHIKVFLPFDSWSSFSMQPTLKGIVSAVTENCLW